MPFVDKPKTIYVGIAAGTFRLPALEGTKGAVSRNITDKKTGKITQVKFEYSHKELMCYIDNVSNYAGQFGDQLLIKCHDNNDNYTIQLPRGSKYATDFLKRLPKVDFSKFVSLNPYSFEADNGLVQGIVIYQEGVKLTNYYVDADKNTINGLPELTNVEASDDFEKDNDFWKYFFSKQYKYMLNVAESLNYDVAKVDTIPAVAVNTNITEHTKPTVAETIKAMEMTTKPAKVDVNIPSGAGSKVYEEPEDDLPF